MAEVDRPTERRDLFGNPEASVLPADIEREPFGAGPVFGIFPLGAVHGSLVHIGVLRRPRGKSR